MSFGITKLISEIGDDNVNLQFLTNCMTGIKGKKGRESSVTFLTDAITPNDVAANAGRVGVILWIERDSFNSAVSNLRKEDDADN